MRQRCELRTNAIENGEDDVHTSKNIRTDILGL